MFERCNNSLDGGKRRIDGSNDSADLAAVFYLEPIDRVDFVGNVFDSKKLIEVAGDSGELLRFGHVPMRLNTFGAGWRLRASILAGRGAASRAPEDMESAAAVTRARRGAGTMLSNLGSGTYFTT